jgi:integrase
MKLTTKTVVGLGLPTGKTDSIYFCETLPGFGLRLRRGAGGRVLRSWIIQYRRSGASRRLLLGSAEVLGAEQARTMAKKALGRIANGEDPQADKAERRDKDRVSLKSMIDEYLKQKQAQVRARTITEVRRYLTGPYFKALHGLAIDKISRKDIAARLVVITREHSSIAAARARAALSAFFVWAMQSGLVEANPVIGTRKPEDTKPRERVLIDQSIEDVNDPRRWRELVAIWKACDDGSEYSKIIRLLILLGARRGEIGGIAWPEIDLERATWTLPARRSKNKQAHILPLMPMAMDIIKSIPRMVSRDQLFGVRVGKYTAWARPKAALDERSGVTGWTVHDVRRSTASGMADIGIAPHIIEEILNHRSGHKAGIAATYNRSRYPVEVRNALAIWEDHLRVLVGEAGERKIVHIAPHAAS